MKTHLARTLICLVCIGLIGIAQSHARTTTPPRVALRVTDLTPDERDLLNQDLRERGDLRISFACVPAGILIIEAVDSQRSAESVRAMALSAIISRLPAERRMEVALTQQEAEDLCSAARTH
ncbi:MAG: hypothetical protein JNM91_08320 [Flavobacteriales bacterium]|nr:hypothetical protein [Flavobacteriales bacterium]